MLTFNNLADLRKYLETRKQMAEKQGIRKYMTNNSPSVAKADGHTAGMVYAFDESLKAVEAYITGLAKDVPLADRAFAAGRRCDVCETPLPEQEPGQPYVYGDLDVVCADCVKEFITRAGATAEAVARSRIGSPNT